MSSIEKRMRPESNRIGINSTPTCPKQHPNRPKSNRNRPNSNRNVLIQTKDLNQPFYVPI
jgi:hypothetical protein